MRVTSVFVRQATGWIGGRWSGWTRGRVRDRHCTRPWPTRSSRSGSTATIEQLAAHVGMGTETLRRKLRDGAWISWVDASTLVLAFPDRKILPTGTTSVRQGNSGSEKYADLRHFPLVAVIGR